MATKKSSYTELAYQSDLIFVTVLIEDEKKIRNKTPTWQQFILNIIMFLINMNSLLDERT